MTRILMCMLVVVALVGMATPSVVLAQTGTDSDLCVLSQTPVPTDPSVFNLASDMLVAGDYLFIGAATDQVDGSVAVMKLSASDLDSVCMPVTGTAPQAAVTDMLAIGSIAYVATATDVSAFTYETGWVTLGGVSPLVDITDLAITKEGILFTATENGVFSYNDESDAWVERPEYTPTLAELLENTGLTKKEITALPNELKDTRVYTFAQYPLNIDNEVVVLGMYSGVCVRSVPLGVWNCATEVGFPEYLGGSGPAIVSQWIVAGNEVHNWIIFSSALFAIRGTNFRAQPFADNNFVDMAVFISANSNDALCFTLTDEVGCTLDNGQTWTTPYEGSVGALVFLPTGEIAVSTESGIQMFPVVELGDSSR